MTNSLISAGSGVSQARRTRLTPLVLWRDLMGTCRVNGTQKILELDLVSAAPDGTNVILLADVDYSCIRMELLHWWKFLQLREPIDGLTSGTRCLGYGYADESVPFRRVAISTSIQTKLPAHDVCTYDDCAVWELHEYQQHDNLVGFGASFSALLGLGLGLGAFPPQARIMSTARRCCVLHQRIAVASSYTSLVLGFFSLHKLCRMEFYRAVVLLVMPIPSQAQ